MWHQSWPSLEIQRHQDSLADLGKLVQERNLYQDDQVDAALARFLVVRTCGFVEQISEECCRAYLQSKSNPQAASFAQSWFGRGNNPNPDALMQLVQRFDNHWAKDFEALLDKEDEFLRRELSYLVDRRNKIAHGLSEGVGVRKALDLVPVGQEIGNWFIVTFDPQY